MRCTRVLPRGCRVPSSRAGGAVRTGPRGPRPFSRFRICLSGNPAPPQDGVGPGAQAAPGTAPSHQAPRPSLSAPSAGEPGEGERTTDPGGLRAVPLGPHPRGRGVRRAEALCPPWVGGWSTPLGGAKGGDRTPRPPFLEEPQPERRGVPILFWKLRSPGLEETPPRLVGCSVFASAEWARRCIWVGTAWPDPKGGPLVAAMVVSSGRVKAAYGARCWQAVPRANGGERGGEQ